jgi:hypothetical protein
MARWMVNVSVVGEGYVIVDADSEAEAISKVVDVDVVLTKTHELEASFAFELQGEA